MKLKPLKTSRKAAIELGVGTMVIIVIAVVLLVLSLVFVRRIFTGATYNVDQLNDAVRGEINKLFGTEGQKIALYLPGNQIELSQGETFGLAFGIKNVYGDDATFNYVITSDSKSGCRTNPDSWVVLRKTGNFNIRSGDVEFGLVSIQVPEEESVGCLAGYKLEVKK